MIGLAISLLLPSFISGQCEVELKKLKGKFPPLLLQNGAFIYPKDKSRVISINDGDTLELYCHGSQLNQDDTYIVQRKKSLKEKSIELSCNKKKFVKLGETRGFNVERASCSQKQEPRLVRTQKECAPLGSDGRTKGLDSLVHVSIGWQIGSKFVEQISLCVDESNFGTLWTKHTVRGASIEFRDKAKGRPGFRVDTSDNHRFFNWTTSSWLTDGLYKKTCEYDTVKHELGGLTKIGSPPEVIIETGDSATNYFAKGHLSPDAAFVYDVEQDATYYYINVAPQFQSFNNGNWKALESSVRDLGKKLGRDLEVVTGTHEILQYKNKKGKNTKIFLEEEKSYVPAPKYYWKVVKDPKTETAAVFIGLNDPHTKEAPKELCENRCGEMGPWVDWELRELGSGYMYCCQLEEAQQAIKSIPSDLTAPGGILMDGVTPGTCKKSKKGDYTCDCVCGA